MVYALTNLGYPHGVRHIGAAIKAKRKPLMTQGEFAARLGLTQPSVSAWEREESMPMVDLLPRIARVLGCSVEDLVVGLDPAYDETRVTSSGSPMVQAGPSNASAPDAQPDPRRPDDVPATRSLGRVDIPATLAAPEAAIYLTTLARDLTETLAVRIRAVAQALLAREIESATGIAAGLRTDPAPHSQPHDRRRRKHRRGA